MRLLVNFKGDFTAADLMTAMNAVSAQPYEGRTSVGTLILASEDACALQLKFQTPIFLSETRALRKAVEMTDSSIHLITDGSVATGLGHLRVGYEKASESSFMLRVLGRGSWELVHADASLMTVSDGHASVPRERLSKETFSDTAIRLFGDSCDVEALWDLALAAAKQSHGTMLVVHENAASEAVRLAPPAMQVEPQQLTDSTLLAVSAIDGAILVDPAGHCHAVGTILDGRAAPNLGDASRGARYNSAIRYLEEARDKCLIIIVSEDGMLNLIPDLPRRVLRSYVESTVNDLEEISRQEPVNFEASHRKETHLRSLGAYLTAEQCIRANDALERVENYRGRTAQSHNGLGFITSVGHALFKPNPHLDESLFLPEEVENRT